MGQWGLGTCRGRRLGCRRRTIKRAPRAHRREPGAQGGASRLKLRRGRGGLTKACARRPRPRPAGAAWRSGAAWARATGRTRRARPLRAVVGGGCLEGKGRAGGRAGQSAGRAVLPHMPGSPLPSPPRPARQPPPSLTLPDDGQDDAGRGVEQQRAQPHAAQRGAREQQPAGVAAGRAAGRVSARAAAAGTRLAPQRAQGIDSSCDGSAIHHGQATTCDASASGRAQPLTGPRRRARP